MDIIFLERIEKAGDNRVTLNSILKGLINERRAIAATLSEMYSRKGKKSKETIQKLDAFNSAILDLKQKQEYVIALIREAKVKEKTINKARRMPLHDARAFVAAAKLLLSTEQIEAIEAEMVNLK